MLCSDADFTPVINQMPFSTAKTGYLAKSNQSFPSDQNHTLIAPYDYKYKLSIVFAEKSLKDAICDKYSGILTIDTQQKVCS